MNCGNRIRLLRIGKGLSQEDFSKSLGVSRQALSQWETGKKGLSVPRMLSIASALGVTPNDLLGIPSDRTEK